MRIIQLRHRRPQRLNACRRPILPSGDTHLNALRPLKAPFDVVFDFWGPLPKICPLGGIFEEAVLVGPFRAPDYASGGARGIETGVWTVTFVGIAELAVDFGGEFAGSDVSGRSGVLISCCAGESRKYLALGSLLVEKRRSLLPWVPGLLIENLRPEKLILGF